MLGALIKPCASHKLEGLPPPLLVAIHPLEDSCSHSPMLPRPSFPPQSISLFFLHCPSLIPPPSSTLLSPLPPSLTTLTYAFKALCSQARHRVAHAWHGSKGGVKHLQGAKHKVHCEDGQAPKRLPTTISCFLSYNPNHPTVDAYYPSHPTMRSYHPTVDSYPARASHLPLTSPSSLLPSLALLTQSSPAFSKT